MRFKITLLSAAEMAQIPISYQYPLSAAVYKILNKADAEFAAFLHEKGYGRGFKLFCFSDLKGKFKLNGDRLSLQNDKVEFEISFYLPEASKNFIKGLFLSQKIEIADTKSRAVFVVQSVEALTNPFSGKQDNEIIEALFETGSACVAGIKNEKSNYIFLNPEDPKFAECLLHNWKEKIKSVFPDEDMESLILNLEIILKDSPPKSRLITVKSGTPQETKVRGWLNFKIKLLGEKRFVELIYESGAGLYNATIGGFLKLDN